MEINWFILSLLSALAFTGMSLLFKISINKGISPILAMFYLLITATIFCGSYIFVVEKSFVSTTNIIYILIIAGIFSFVGNALMAKAMGSVSNPGYVEAVASFRIVIIAVAAIFLFNLKLQPVGILGSLLVLAGIILLSMVS